MTYNSQSLLASVMEPQGFEKYWEFYGQSIPGHVLLVFFFLPILNMSPPLNMTDSFLTFGIFSPDFFEKLQATIGFHSGHYDVL